MKKGTVKGTGQMTPAELAKAIIAFEPGTPHTCTGTPKHEETDAKLIGSGAVRRVRYLCVEPDCPGETFARVRCA